MRFDARILPRGRLDLLRQLALFLCCYLLYELARAAAVTSGGRPFDDATRIIELERRLHLFFEPGLQEWVRLHAHWLVSTSVLVYLNAHLFVTAGALAFVYFRRTDSFEFVRNAFLIAMALALVGYVAFPTAPPRLMLQWGFTDVVRQFTGVPVDRHTALVNPYAAVPSMHVCFAFLAGISMWKLTSRRAVRALWLAYPVLVSFVVVVTANHYLADAVLGAFAALAAYVLAGRLARARPEHPALSEAPA